MSLRMEHRDYTADATGSVASVSGGGAVLSEILFRLTARRGSFPLLPELGSRLHLLPREKPSHREALARQYAAEALAELSDAEVTAVTVTPIPSGLGIRVDLLWQGEPLSVELEESV